MSTHPSGAPCPSLEPKSDLNITPLIDVLLVLLVLFLVSLPLAQRGLDGDLPAETQKASAAPPPSQIVVEVAADRSISINHEPVALANLQARLAEVFATRQDRTVYVIGDGSLAYGHVVAVIDSARAAGITRVGIVTEKMRREG